MGNKYDVLMDVSLYSRIYSMFNAPSSPELVADVEHSAPLSSDGELEPDTGGWRFNRCASQDAAHRAVVSRRP